MPSTSAPMPGARSLTSRCPRCSPTRVSTSSRPGCPTSCRSVSAASSLCIVLPLIHFIPCSLRESVHLFLKRQFDRTLPAGCDRGGRGGQAGHGFRQPRARAAVDGRAAAGRGGGGAASARGRGPRLAAVLGGADGLPLRRGLLLAGDDGRARWARSYRRFALLARPLHAIFIK